MCASHPQGLSLEQSVSQFSHTMTAQADLRVEAAHLRRFLHNFGSMLGSITSPEPVEPWVTEAVLVESFEPGASVDRYIQDPAPFNTKVLPYTLAGGRNFILGCRKARLKNSRFP